MKFFLTLNFEIELMFSKKKMFFSDKVSPRACAAWGGLVRPAKKEVVIF